MVDELLKKASVYDIGSGTVCIPADLDADGKPSRYIVPLAFDSNEDAIRFAEMMIEDRINAR